MAFLVIGVVVSTVLAGAACFLAYQLIQQNGRILMRLDALETREPAAAPVPQMIAEPSMPPGLAIGTPAPDFELPDLWGGKGSLRDLRGRPVLLTFFNPRCGYCVQVAPRLAAIPWQKHGTGLAPLIVTSGTTEENLELVKQHGIRCPVLLQEGMEIGSRYEALGTPIGYLIDAEGRIASEMAVGADALMALAAGQPRGDGDEAKPKGNKPLSESRIARDGLEKGTPAPGFRLPTVEGREIALEDFRGHALLLVFSDPECGPCEVLAPDLEALQKQRPDVRVLMVSRGTVEENAPKVAELGLTFPVALQKKWEISMLYAMFGTPIGYLIDAEGLIAADVAVGADPILELLRGAPSSNGKTAQPKEVAPMR